MKTTTTAVKYLVWDTQATSLRLGIPSVARTTEKFAGTLQNVRVWNRALTTAEVASINSTTAPVLTPPADVTVPATGIRTLVSIGQATTSTGLSGVVVNNDAPYDFPSGTTVVTWTATDTNGNVSTATQNVTVVSGPPAAPAVTGVTTDTGISSTDAITSDTTLLIKGSADSTTTSVTVTRADLGIIGTAVSSSGAWSLDYTGTTLAEGVYTFTATAANTQGSSGVSNAFVVTVDTTAPGAPVITGGTGTPVVFNGTAEASSKVVVSQTATGIIGGA